MTEDCIPLIGVFKLYKDAKIPERMTELSACYDVFAYLGEEVDTVKIVDGYNNASKQAIKDGTIEIPAFGRALIPTGCKFKIPSGKSIRIHPRSGNALNRGLTLPNCEGVIDCDYTKQTFALIANNTFVPQIICNGDRVCQLELVPVIEFQFKILSEDFGDFTDRKGGLGSTGVK